MQHGTGREVVREAVENALAVLVREMKYADVQASLSYALGALQDGTDLDERGVYGPDYGRFDARHDRLVSGSGVTQDTTGSIRDSRPEGLGR